MIFAMDFDDCSVTDTDCSQDGLEQFIDFRDRLFSRITFEYCLIIMDGEPSTLEFLLRFLETFTVKQFRFFHVRTTEELENSMQLMAAFPHSTYTMEIQSISEPERMLLIPPMEKLEIKQLLTNSKVTPVLFDVVLKLINAQKHMSIFSGCLILSLEEWKIVMQAISECAHERFVRWDAKNPTTVQYLSTFGITKATRTGDAIRGISHVWHEKEVNRSLFASCGFRYQNCYTTVRYVEWSGGMGYPSVTMTNRGGEFLKHMEWVAERSSEEEGDE